MNTSHVSLLQIQTSSHCRLTQCVPIVYNLSSPLLSMGSTLILLNHQIPALTHQMGAWPLLLMNNSFKISDVLFAVPSPLMSLWPSMPFCTSHSVSVASCWLQKLRVLTLTDPTNQTSIYFCVSSSPACRLQGASCFLWEWETAQHTTDNRSSADLSPECDNPPANWLSFNKIWFFFNFSFWDNCRLHAVIRNNWFLDTCFPQWERL